MRTEAVRTVAGVAITALVLAIFFLQDSAIRANGVLGGLAGLVFALGLMVSPRPRLDLRRAWPYLAYLTALTVSMLLSRNVQALAEYGRQLLFLGLVFGIARLVTTDLLARRLLALVLLSTFVVLLSALGFGAWVDTEGRPAFYGSVPQWSGYPELGMLAAMGTAACLAVAALGEPLALWFSSLMLAACFTVAALLLYSRSAWVTIGAVAAWLAVVASLRWRRWKVALAVGVLLVAAAGAAGFSPLLRRYAASFAGAHDSPEVAARMAGWRVAGAMIRDHPLFGVGPGNYPVFYPRYSSGVDRTHAYNVILHTGAELGLLGLAGLLAIWVRALWRSLTMAGPGAPGVTAFALHSTLLAFVIRSQSEHFLASSLGTSFRMLTLIGLAIGLVEAVVRKPSPAPPPEPAPKRGD